MSYVKVGAIALSAFMVTAFVWASESDELRERARAMQQEASLLADRGHVAEAEQLERKAIAMLEEAEQFERRGHRDDREIQALKERLVKIRIEQQEMQRSGSVERFNDLSLEAEKIERELLSGEHHEHDDLPDGIARRLEHMGAAMEHLHEAGLHEIAAHVEEIAEATERELHEQHRHHDEDVAHAILSQLEEIRRDIGRLRDEVNELKADR
ncbi:MAG: hypothetical protein AAFX06_28185 [Planctomycetota bacterium]